MVLVEPLHGLTFALLHLACMQMLSVVVPLALAATAQAIYGGVAVGTMTAIITLVSGPLYGALGPGAGSGANGRIWPAMMSAELPEGWA